MLFQICDAISSGSYRDATNTDRNSPEPLARSGPRLCVFECAGECGACLLLELLWRSFAKLTLTSGIHPESLQGHINH